MSTLEVPDEAMKRLYSVPVFDDREKYVQHARDVAAPVVAAELRRLADEHQYEGGIVDVGMLRFRADELDPS